MFSFFLIKMRVFLFEVPACDGQAKYKVPCLRQAGKINKSLVSSKRYSTCFRQYTFLNASPYFVLGTWYFLQSSSFFNQRSVFNIS